MRQPDTFLKSLANTKAGPCLLCAHFDRCAAEKLACRDFELYTHFKSIRSVDVDRHPNKRTYNHIFEQGDPDGSMRGICD